jgi:hypothetical protein
MSDLLGEDVERVDSKIISRRFPLGWGVFCFSFLLLTYVLPAPALPALGIEQGWQQLLSVAFLRHAQFGRDILFTYGPWGFLSEPLGDPRLYGWLLAGRGFIAVACSAALSWLAAGRPGKALILVVLTVVLLPGSPAGLVLLLFVLIYVRPKPAPAWLLLLLLCACSLAAHTKLSLGFLFFSLLLCLSVDEVFRLRRFPWLAMWSAGAYVIWYEIAGQRLRFLLDYLSSSRAVLGGYGGAMGLSPTKTFPALVLLLCLAGLGLWVADAITHGSIGRMSATVWLGLYFLVGMKQAFGRADAVHLWWGCFNLILPGLMLVANELAPGVAARRAASYVLCAAGFSLLAFVYSYWHGNTVGQDHATDTARNLARAAEDWFHRGSLDAAYRTRMEDIRQSCSVPMFSGAIDVFGNRLACGLAYGERFRWRPTALLRDTYTGNFSRRNADYLLSNQAAPNMLLDIRPTDNHYAPLEDSLSWLTLLRVYQPQTAAGEDILFTRTAPRELSMEPLLQRTVSFGESVEIPETDEPIWAEIDVPLSAAGSAASLLLCVPQIALHLRSAGRTQQYRFLADTARAGFLLSPAITTPASFCSLYPNQRIATARPERVESLALLPPSGPAFYRQPIGIRLYRLLIHW